MMGYENNRDALAASLEELAQESDREGKAREDAARRLNEEARHRFEKSQLYREAARLVGNLGPEDARLSILSGMLDRREGRTAIRREDAEALDRKFEEHLEHPTVPEANEIMRILHWVAERHGQE